MTQCMCGLICLNFCLLNLLLVRSHQEKIIIVKRLIQGRKNLTRMQVEPRSCNQGIVLKLVPVCNGCKIMNARLYFLFSLNKNSMHQVQSFPSSHGTICQLFNTISGFARTLTMLRTV